MTYREQNFSQRFGEMGDRAESAFERMMQSTGSTYEVFGWRRPSTGMGKMSPMLRFMPDFYTGKGWLVEVMGCGRDGILKGMKLEKVTAMRDWHRKVQPVAFWLWNSHLREGVWITFDQMEKLVARSVEERGIKAFEVDGNQYHELPWTWLQEAADDGT